MLENVVGYLRNGELELSNLCIVFSTPENLLVGISGALGEWGSHFLSWNMFSENAMEYLRNSEC